MKEREIRDPDVHRRFLELLEEDIARIFTEPESYERIPCPACAALDLEESFVKFGFTYGSCSECRTLYALNRPPGDQFRELYEASESTRFWVEEFFKPVAEARRDKIFRPRARYVQERFRDYSEGTIVDVGSGFGLFLEELPALWPDAELVAIEPATSMAEICRSKGLRVLEHMVEDVPAGAVTADLVTSFELFEHVRDPGDFLLKLREMLKPGGHLLLTTLNGLGFDIQVLWDESRSVFPPHHLNFLNPSSMTTLLEQCGFKVEDVETPGLLDWDIVQNDIAAGVPASRFWRTVADHASEESKKALQSWVTTSGFSSHMRVVARAV